jgi:osmotically-inducible protein OsmY
VSRAAAPLLAAMLLAMPGCEAALSPFGLALTAGSIGGRMALQERGLGTGISDTAIQLGINNAWLEADPAIFRLVDSHVHEGRVLLTGVVKYPETRIEAVRLVWTVDGVRAVINEITLSDTRTLADAPMDAWISARLRAAMVFDPEINAVNFAVDTVDRTVFVMGIARSQAELDLVLATARGIGGVRGVVSHVRLRSEPPPTRQAAAP